MFPSEILERLATLLLGPVAERYINASKDRRRRFAQALLRYHQNLGEYLRVLADLTQHIDRQKELSSTGELSPATATRLEDLSRRLAELVELLVGTFELEWREEWSKTQRSRSKAARRRASVLVVLDNRLAVLMQLAHHADVEMRFSELARSLAKWRINQHSQTIRLFRSWGSAAMAKDIHEGRADESIVEIRFDNPEAFQIFRAEIDRNRAIVERLEQRIRRFMKSQFTIDDLV